MNSRMPPWLARRLPADFRLVIGLLAASGALLAFFLLAGEVREGEATALDGRILLALRQPGNLAVPIGPHWLLPAMRDISALGGVTVMTMLTLAVAGWLLVIRRRGVALRLVAAIGSGALLNTLLKFAFDRSRPDVVPHLVDIHSLSFPSGHAAMSAIVYPTLAVLVARQQRGPARLYPIALAAVLMALIGFSRLYLGVHWPSDVLGGWTAGLGWAALWWTLERGLGGTPPHSQMR